MTQTLQMLPWSQRIIDKLEHIKLFLVQEVHYLKIQAAADITGQLQFRPMVYTLYIGNNLTIIMEQYGDRQTDTNI